MPRLAATLLLVSLCGCDNAFNAPSPPAPDRSTPTDSNATSTSSTSKTQQRRGRRITYVPRRDFDTSGFSLVGAGISAWSPNSTLQQIADLWTHAGTRAQKALQTGRAALRTVAQIAAPAMAESMLLNYEGKASDSYAHLCRLRTLVESDPAVAQQWLYSVIYFQGVTAFRMGEDSNCIHCRGESSCILPLNPDAFHRDQNGATLAAQHFLEYLSQFPDDRQVEWMLNLTQMTLGNHPQGVPQQHRISLESWGGTWNNGPFRELSTELGIDRFNQSGGGILQDWDGDGLLDLLVTSFDPATPASIYRNCGQRGFVDVSDTAGVQEQLGGLYAVQADYDNDGFTDVFIPRGAWFLCPVRPTLLRNEGDGTWSDVTTAAGLSAALNSNSACWGDFDNDGNPDLFVCCELQPNRLYRNRGDGQFELVPLPEQSPDHKLRFCKGAVWTDLNNDGWLDLFLNNLQGVPQVLQNNSGSSFTDITSSTGITGPEHGFACWSWDYDNDGWLDLFATSYERSVPDVVAGMLNLPEQPLSSRLWRNTGNGSFVDVSRDVGVSAVFETMGCNFADLDNDGWLDFYLGTGDPEIATLIPNRMFHNVAGKRFEDITAATRTGSLQKGHAVSFGDWDRNGQLDLFVQMGGAAPGDSYHNLMFQNPGSSNHALRLRLVETTGCRSSIGTRVTVITDSPEPREIHVVMGTGASFGANPLELHIGTGTADRVRLLRIQWAGTNKVTTYQDLPVSRLLTIVEGRSAPLDTDPGQVPGFSTGTAAATIATANE